MVFIIPSLRDKLSRPSDDKPGAFSLWLKNVVRSLRAARHKLRAAKLRWTINRFEKKREREMEKLQSERRAAEAKPIPVLDEVPTSAAPVRSRLAGWFAGKSAARQPELTAADAPEAEPGDEPSVQPQAPAVSTESAVESPAPVMTAPESVARTDDIFPPLPSALLEKDQAEEKDRETIAADAPAPPPPTASGKLAQRLAKERADEEAVQHRLSIEDRFWQSYPGLRTNLVKNQQTVFFNWRQRLLVLALSLMLCCLSLSVTYIGLLIWQKELVDQSRESIVNYRALDAEIAHRELEMREVIDFNQKLVLVNSLLQNHIYWNNFLILLEDTTLKDVYLERFSGDISGEYVIPTVGRNLETISLQLEVLKGHPDIRSVDYENSQALVESTEDSRVKFDLKMSADPAVFIK